MRWDNQGLAQVREDIASHQRALDFATKHVPLDDDIWIEVGPNSIKLQPPNQEEARVLRRMFPPATWRKNYNAPVGWWEYSTSFGPIQVKLYGIADAPASCELVTESYESEEDVPVAFERRVVTRTRTKMVCGNQHEGDN